MTRAICFDFDGTLAHYTGDFAAFVAGLRAELSLTQCDMRGFGESLSQHLRAEGAVTLRSALEATLAGLEQRPPPDIEEVATRAVAAYAAQVALRPGAREVLAMCAQRVPLALVTNGPEDMQRAAVRAVGLEAFFRTILISGDRDVGVRKPHPRLFDLACTGLERRPEETLMVGDDLHADIEGALVYGMRAVYVGGDGGEGFDAVPDLFALHKFLEAPTTRLEG
ncbi:HAD family hydrolase [Truepera radiovictrix]|uniref:HAD-superfamily hydrolase, subfamily IA, variant 3 n=1 Tax=Truepera radiovictrix (strain DSM 17093 / CIP 108686 / LMG 22925 / RQ-24) TaxID=649638 RepID=D7CTU1_TRURR|nr:HAD family hydrolase [Truepera radiovictrix]ADI15638.1 HAD-superfamily hydrolase, subfamily IA, variant 3 [Truepera radiovictrix DSM 17093]WMT58733.1 HAD family hydrolase [Truepera radiovictrix]